MLVEVVLDFLEIILDAAESAAMPAGLEEEDEVAWLLCMWELAEVSSCVPLEHGPKYLECTKNGDHKFDHLLCGVSGKVFHVWVCGLRSRVGGECLRVGWEACVASVYYFTIISNAQAT